MRQAARRPATGASTGQQADIAGARAVATYFSAAPADLTQASSAVAMLALSPLDWAFYLAILGEVTFMAFAISTMSQSQQARQRAAVREAEALRDAARTAASQHADALKTSGQRIEALEKRLAKDPGNLVDAPVEQRLIQAATDRVLEHLSEPGFGSLSWPPHSRPAKRLWAAG